MEDDSLAQKYLLSTQETQAKIEAFEKDVKETMKSLVFDKWDPENREIINQFVSRVELNEYLKERIVQKDVEIFRLRDVVEDKRRSLKQSRVGLDSLKSLVRKTEESLFQRDLIISEQSEKIAGYIEGNTKKAVQKTMDSCRSNKFLPINGSYQGVYMTKAVTKPEDKGKQELNMPFLSFSAQNWISSLRTPTKSPVRRV